MGQQICFGRKSQPIKKKVQNAVKQALFVSLVKTGQFDSNEQEMLQKKDITVAVVDSA